MKAVPDNERIHPAAYPEAIGAYLRQERERQEMTLEEVSEATKIRRSYLEAMEIGQLDRLPGPVYARGFLRNYARLLNLPAADLVQGYNRYWESQGENEEEKGDAAAEPEPGGGLSTPRFTPRTLTVVILALVVIAGYVVVSAMLEPTDTPEPAPIAEESPEEEPEPEEPPEPEPEPETRITQTEDTPGAAAFEVSPGPVTITIATLPGERCWVRVESNGEVYEETLEPEQEREFQAEEALLMRVGNAGGLTLQVNDKDLGSAGDPGMPRNILFEVS